MWAAYTLRLRASPVYNAWFMSRSFLAGTTVYQSMLAVQVVRVSARTDGESWTSSCRSSMRTRAGRDSETFCLIRATECPPGTRETKPFRANRDVDPMPDMPLMACL